MTAIGVDAVTNAVLAVGNARLFLEVRFSAITIVPSLPPSGTLRTAAYPLPETC